jgi:hypothetical protein
MNVRSIQRSSAASDRKTRQAPRPTQTNDPRLEREDTYPVLLSMIFRLSTLGSRYADLTCIGQLPDLLQSTSNLQNERFDWSYGEIFPWPPIICFPSCAIQVDPWLQDSPEPHRSAAHSHDQHSKLTLTILPWLENVRYSAQSSRTPTIDELFVLNVVVGERASRELW